MVDAGSAAIQGLPNSQDFDPADRAFFPFYKRLAELNVPLLTHTSFEHAIPPVNQLWGKPERLTLALETGTTVIAAHCAGAGTAHPIREDYFEWLNMLSRYPRLFGDVWAMASWSRFQYLARVLESPMRAMGVDDAILHRAPSVLRM